MICVDTNVLVRYLLRDDPAQTRLATRFIESLTPEAPGFITTIVLAELSWVLASTYGATRAEIAHALDTLLSVDAFVIEHQASVRRALAAANVANVDFADALIGAIGWGAGCAETVSFDSRAARLPGFRLLG